MSEWVGKPLKDLVSFKKGKKVETSDLPLDGFQPYLGASSLTGGEDGFALPIGGVFCVESDTLMLWDGERSGLVGPGKPGVISSTVMRLRPEGEMLGRYLLHFLRDRFDWIQARRTGTGVPHVPKDLGRILTPCFPRREALQTQICDILDALDTQIEATEALIAKQERVRAGLMQDLFTRGVDEHGQLRPPRDQAPHLYHQTELGWLPLGWEVDALQNLAATDITYGIVQAGPHVLGGIPYIRTGDMSGEALGRESLLCTTPAIAASFQRSRVQSGEIVIAIRATIGKALIVPPELEGANLTQGTARFASNAKLDRRFALRMLRCRQVDLQIAIHTKGTTFSEITLADLRTVIAPFSTDLGEQRKIAETLDASDSRLEQLKSERSKLRLQKTGLMQDLLTGKVSVAPLLESVAA